MVEWLENAAGTEEERMNGVESYHTVSDIVDSSAIIITLSVLNNLPVLALPYANVIVRVIATDMVC